MVEERPPCFMPPPLGRAAPEVAVDRQSLSPEFVTRLIGASSNVLGAIDGVATLPRLADELLPRVLADAGELLRSVLAEAGYAAASRIREQ